MCAGEDVEDEDLDAIRAYQGASFSASFGAEDDSINSPHIKQRTASSMLASLRGDRAAATLAAATSTGGGASSVHPAQMLLERRARAAAREAQSTKR